MDVFRVRLNCVDHYQATPTEFEPQILQSLKHHGSSGGPTFPVIRVFGATQTGQKVCAHVHGALPYMYIEYDGPYLRGDAATYIQRLRLSINHALAVSYRRTSSHDNMTYVAHISLVKGVPFYGYHLGFTRFLKIYLFNPLQINRLADLLRQGAVMKKSIQPFESHMQYIPQWMCDYNLFGCDYLDCGKVKFRTPIPSRDSFDGSSNYWHDGTITKAMLTDSEQLQRQSHCSIEVDVCVQDILNRLDIKSRDLHHDLLEKTNPFTNEDKIVHSMAGLWKDETRRRKARMGLSESDGSPFPPEVLVTVSADPRNSSPGGWIHEKEYRGKMAAIVNSEVPRHANAQEIDEDLKTSFESVEDLHSVNIPNIIAYNGMLASKVRLDGAMSRADIDVDESRVLSMHDELDASDTDNEEDAKSVTSVEEQDFDGFLDRASGAGNQHIEHGLQTSKHNEIMPGSPNTPSHAEDSLVTPNTVAMKPEPSGVRDIGDYGYVNEDAFEIPGEYTSRPTLDGPSVKRIKNEPEQPLGTNKRRKILPKEESSRVIHGRLDSPSQQLESNLSDAPKRIRGGSRSASSEYPVVNGPSGNKERLNDPMAENVSGHRASESLGQHIHKLPQRKHGASDRGEASSRSEQYSRDDSAENWKSPDNTLCLEQTREMVSTLRKSFSLLPSSQILCMPTNAPALSMPLSQDGLLSVIHKDAHYSDEEDVPERGREYAGKEFKLEGTTVPFLPDFDASGSSLASKGQKPATVINRLAFDAGYNGLRHDCSLSTWEIKQTPPTREIVQQWLEHDLSGSGVAKGRPATSASALSQVTAPTQKHKYGAKYSQNKKSSSSSFETQYMSVMSLEIHVNTRGSLVPDPEKDEILCIFWCFQSDKKGPGVDSHDDQTHVGILVHSEHGGMKHHIGQQTAAEVDEEATELDLLTRLVDIVRERDPDILTGFEVHGGSWGYLIERARFKYDYNLCDELSRMKSMSHGRFGKEADRWGFNHTSTIRVTGRHMINIWRAMRGELNLLQYTMENIVFHILHRRVPHYSFLDLTVWYKSGDPRDLAKVLTYHVSRVQLDLQILEQNELVARTSEQARLLGVDFYSVFSRGSQFKVESLMFRIAKPENFILISPSRKQVGQQNALECLPLVMEPQSAFYSSPVLVLDFQSLYPSVMIAYNYCYSTFLGRVVQWRGQNKMGFSDYAREPGLINALKDHINIAPNGIMYAKPEARKSLLAKMLGEILETRVMVKSGMKVEKEDRQLQRLLNNRQLALKLIANVTYGYTSASFSGRMPCSEIADSIVQTGRETLEKSIALIHSVEKWGAEVVYGDTDSLFIHLRGRTREEAFNVGKEIAETITEMNPKPVKLKFEKVYHPCVLIAKKRYVGFKYESPKQTEPEFDAKGIETVRRDGTPAEQKIEEKALKILFKTADLSRVKQYFQKQCTKIMRGKVSIQDFCFAKEVKLGTYSDKGPPPPGALISARRMLEDPRAEPQYGERVPYVVIAGAPGARLIDRCVGPDVLLQDDQLELDAEYYISKNLIPPLERIFNLVGANVRQWYDEMPRFQRIRRIDTATPSMGKELVLSKKTLESYMSSSACVVCKLKIDHGMPVCERCMSQASTSILTLRQRLRASESKAVSLQKVCRSCAGLAFGDEVKCDSKDCPVFYSRSRHMAGLGGESAGLQAIMKLIDNNDGAALEW